MWSPYTAPASAAPTATRNSGSSAANTPIMMGRISAMVPHARTHGETDERRHYEDDGRQKVETHAQAIQEAGNELAGAQEVAAACRRAIQASTRIMMAPTMERTPSDMASTKPPSVHELARQEHASGHHERHARADAQAHDRILADRRGEVDAAEEAAHVHHAQNGEHDEHQNGHDKIPDAYRCSEMFRPLNSSMAPAAASSMSPSSVTTVGMFERAFQIDLGLVGDAGESTPPRAPNPRGECAPFGTRPRAAAHRAEVLLAGTA